MVLLVLDSNPAAQSLLLGEVLPTPLSEHSSFFLNSTRPLEAYLKTRARTVDEVVKFTCFARSPTGPGYQQPGAIAPYYRDGR